MFDALSDTIGGMGIDYFPFFEGHMNHSSYILTCVPFIHGPV
jgi:hypothetical protein